MPLAGLPPNCTLVRRATIEIEIEIEINSQLFVFVFFFFFVLRVAGSRPCQIVHVWRRDAAADLSRAHQTDASLSIEPA